MSRIGWGTLAAALSLFWGVSAHAESDVIDSRITFVLADDNVFARSRDRSPDADIGQRSNNKTFFDNYDTKDSGQETKTNFVFYKDFRGPFPRIVSEAGLVARFDFFLDEETGRPGTRFFDDGTFLQLNYLLEEPTGDLKNPAKQKNRIFLLAFPFNADRMRLGYSYDITWGGNPIFPKNTTGAPGLKLGWDGEKAYAFLGAKTHRQLNEDTNRLDAVYGFLAGGGIDITECFRWEAGAGFFQKGVFAPENAAQSGPLDGKGVAGEGASTQVTYHVGMPIDTSVDLRLYRNDPRFPWRAFREEKYAEELAYLAAAEATVINQNLRHPEKFGSTQLQHGYAGDINLRVKRGYLRLTLDFVYRDLAFILYNVPSFTPYYAFPKTAKSRAEWFVAGGADYYVEDWRFNFGLIAGYQRPSTYVGDTASLGDDFAGVNRVVVRRQGDFDILPLGQKAFDILSLRGFGRWDATDGMSALLEVTYTLDKNAARLKHTRDGTLIRKFDVKRVTNQLALALMLQARF